MAAPALQTPTTAQTKILRDLAEPARDAFDAPDAVIMIPAQTRTGAVTAELSAPTETTARTPIALDAAGVASFDASSRF